MPNQRATFNEHLPGHRIGICNKCAGTVIVTGAKEVIKKGKTLRTLVGQCVDCNAEEEIALIHKTSARYKHLNEAWQKARANDEQG